MNYLAIMLGTQFLVVCANIGISPYFQCYHEKTGGIDWGTQNRFILPDPKEKLRLHVGNNRERCAIKMLEEDYVMVGNSSYL